MAKLPDDRRAAFTAAYQFYERFWDMPDTAAAWNACTAEMGRIISERDTTLVRELLRGCFDAIDLENAEARRMLV